MASSAGGREVLSAFQNEYPLLHTAGNSLASEIEASFLPCPPDPTRNPLTFLMGSPETDEDAYADEKPQIPITVKPFRMADAPVTKAQFCLYDPAHQQEPAIADDLKRYSPEANCPVIYVTWYDAWCFAKWCRANLPTEVEWEFACRAGTKTRYWWGDKIDKTKCTIDENHTTAASRQHANPWGLMEMSGNVYEWCDTWYADEIATSADREYVGDSRVLRGGSFDLSPLVLRSADRFRSTPEFRFNLIGFRISRTP